jgi:hypothetical protein
MHAFGEQFEKTFAYNLARTRIVFGLVPLGDPALTYKDTIILDPAAWMSRGSLRQSALLVHELTHCVQYYRLGAAFVMSRRLAQGVGYRLTLRDPYEVSPELERIKDLTTLDVGAFTIESVARHVENEIILNRHGRFGGR